MTLYQLMLQLSGLYTLFSVEKPCLRASNGEIKRWILNGAVAVNGYTDRDPCEVLDYPVLRLVIHPRSVKRRTTLI